MDLGIKDKVILVAASSKGLGYGVALQLAREGAILSLGSRKQKDLQNAADAIRKEIPNARILTSPLDVSQKASIKQWIHKSLNDLGSIYGLVVNGGGPPPGTFEDLDDESWHSGYENTLMSAVRMIREVLPEMKRRKEGSILTITSSSIKEPIDNLLLSNVFRSGVTSLVKSLSFQVAGDNIRINNLVPGFFDTDRLRELDLRNSREWRISLENVRHINFENIPMGRYGRAEEFGSAASFLLSSAASYVTGETFIIDGGKMRTVW